MVDVSVVCVPTTCLIFVTPILSRWEHLILKRTSLSTMDMEKYQCEVDPKQRLNGKCIYCLRLCSNIKTKDACNVFDLMKPELAKVEVPFMPHVSQVGKPAGLEQKGVQKGSTATPCVSRSVNGMRQTASGM